MSSSEADREPTLGRMYEVRTIVGFTGAHTNFLVCPDCGGLVEGSMQNVHDEFHDSIEVMVNSVLGAQRRIENLRTQLNSVAAGRSDHK
jgi:hypothetical protein